MNGDPIRGEGDFSRQRVEEAKVGLRMGRIDTRMDHISPYIAVHQASAPVRGGGDGTSCIPPTIIQATCGLRGEGSTVRCPYPGPPFYIMDMWIIRVWMWRPSITTPWIHHQYMLRHIAIAQWEKIRHLVKIDLGAVNGGIRTEQVTVEGPATEFCGVVGPEPAYSRLLALAPTPHHWEP